MNTQIDVKFGLIFSLVISVFFAPSGWARVEYGVWGGPIHQMRVGEATLAQLQVEFRYLNGPFLMGRFGFQHQIRNGFFLESGFDRIQNQTPEVRMWQGVGHQKSWIPDRFSTLLRYRLETRLSDDREFGLRSRLFLDIGDLWGFHLIDELFITFSPLVAPEKIGPFRNRFGVIWMFRREAYGIQLGGLVESVKTETASLHHGLVLIVRPTLTF